MLPVLARQGFDGAASIQPAGCNDYRLCCGGARPATTVPNLVLADPMNAPTRAAALGRWAERLKGWGRRLKQDVVAVWLAARDPRTPWPARITAAAVAAYALSPIDLIPDFIPVLGYLDELVILPLGVALVVRLIPPELMRAFRDAAAALGQRPSSRYAAVLIVAVWTVALTASVLLLARHVDPNWQGWLAGRS